MPATVANIYICISAAEVSLAKVVCTGLIAN